MTLREQLIEAAASVMGHCEPYAEEALDAILDVLEEQLDETVHLKTDERAGSALRDIWTDELVAVLREKD